MSRRDTETQSKASITAHIKQCKCIYIPTMVQLKFQYIRIFKKDALDMAKNDVIHGTIVNEDDCYLNFK